MQLNHYPNVSDNSHSSNVYYLEPSTKQTQQRVIHRSKVHLFSVTVLLLLIFLISGYHLMPFNKVNQLEIIGTVHIPADTVAESTDIGAFDNKRKVIAQKAEIEAQLKEVFPLIESIRFSTNGWSNLQIHINEHQLVGFLQQGADVQFLLDDGSLLTVEESVDMLEFDDGLMMVLPELMSFDSTNELVVLGQAFHQLDPEIIHQMIRIEYDAMENRIKILMADGNEVHGVLSTIGDKIPYYLEMRNHLEGQHGIINLEVGAYFEPYS